MAINSSDCSPYLSVSIFKSITEDPPSPRQLIDAIRKVVKENADKKNLETPRFFSVEDPELTVGETAFALRHYSEKRPPSWFSGEGILDSYNHLLVVAKRGSLYSLLFTDNGLKNSLAKKVARASEGVFSKIKRLSSSEINKSFVEDQVRTLWLSGAHRRTTIKPDSKILSGLELETSLDPLGDQTFYFSSVRSTMSLSEQGGQSVVGASPTGSKIWLGPTRTWDEFSSSVDLILARAETFMNDADRTDKPIPILASASNSLEGIEHPYDVALIVPEQVNSENGNAGDDEDRWIQQFGDAAKFEVAETEGSPDFEANVLWAETLVGRLKYEFEQTDNSEIRVKISKVSGFDNEDRDAEILEICRKSENLTIYFDSGHTFSRGHFYETRFRDARFTDWWWVPMTIDETNFDQEKPLDGRRFDVENLGGPEDKSLFGMTVRHWPRMEADSPQTGWLVCDDGAMESADFIHIDEESDPPKITLIHVKGSGSDSLNRGLSVSDYEVVVGQAIKNLRHIDRNQLKEKLTTNADGVLQNAVWHNGERQDNRDGLLEMLDRLGSNIDKEVVVFQPRVRHSVLRNIRGHMDAGNLNRSDVRRMQQLDTLLLGARADCFSLGSYFRVISDLDDV